MIHDNRVVNHRLITQNISVYTLEHHSCWIGSIVWEHVEILPCAAVVFHRQCDVVVSTCQARKTTSDTCLTCCTLYHNISILQINEIRIRISVPWCCRCAIEQSMLVVGTANEDLFWSERFARRNVHADVFHTHTCKQSFQLHVCVKLIFRDTNDNTSYHWYCGIVVFLKTNNSLISKVVFDVHLTKDISINICHDIHLVSIICCRETINLVFLKYIIMTCNKITSSIKDQECHLINLGVIAIAICICGIWIAHHTRHCSPIQTDSYNHSLVLVFI